MADTGGEGVDIILNSLTSPGFIEANLSILAPGEYLAEMSKRNVWTPEQVSAVRSDIGYVPFDLGEIYNHQPEVCHSNKPTLTNNANDRWFSIA